MSHSSGFSGSSLIHLNRPAQLGYEPSPALEVVVHDDADNEAPESIASSPTSSILHNATVFYPPPAGPSMKLDTARVHLQRPHALRRASSFGHISTVSTVSSSPERIEGCVDLLRSVNPSVRVAKASNEWQPDADSALCNHPFCSTMFGQTTLSLGPRRHHCRLCGLIFCSRHSTTRLALQTVDSKKRPVIASLRVCDGCRVNVEDDRARRRSSDATPSLASSEASANDDLFVNPETTWVSPLTMGRSLSHTAVADLQPRLAPIEHWMDRSGVLSLYPLAVKPSHSRRSVSPAATRAVGPLFAPTLSERRCAQEKEIERLTLRRRRNVHLWVSTPVGSDAESEGDDSSSMTGAAPSGTKTPQERELDWSTF